MIFWLCVIGLAIGIGLCILGTRDWDSSKHHWLWYNDEEITVTGVVISVIMAIVVLIMGLFIFAEHNAADANLAALREKEVALTYKLESGACRDEFGLLSKSVIDEIQDWNVSIARKKNLQNNFWSGIFYADIYNEFESIDYTKYAKE